MAPPTHRTVRFIKRGDGTYRKCSTPYVHDLLDRGVIVLEGVDGDEGLNTVTYYYVKNEEY